MIFIILLVLDIITCRKITGQILNPYNQSYDGALITIDKFVD